MPNGKRMVGVCLICFALGILLTRLLAGRTFLFLLAALIVFAGILLIRT